MEMFWDNDAVFKQRLIGTHTMSLGPGLSLPQLSYLSYIDFMLRFKFQQDSGSSSDLQISGSTLSFFCPYPRILRKVLMHLIHFDWSVLHCLFILSDQCDVMLWLI